MSGDILINDSVKMDRTNFGLFSKYVMQDDILYSHFTVKEALMFAADLKISNMSAQEREARVDKIIKDLGLQKC